jgi:23S rRNA (guanosine2251-2'-O)-methyltransferase
MSRRRGRSRPTSDHDVVYGRRPVFELLKAGRRHVSRVIVHDSHEPRPELESVLTMARKAHASIEEGDRRRLDALTNGANHQGIAAESGVYPYCTLEDRPANSHALWLLLDHIQDPQNLGSLLRSADTAGVTGVVIPQARAVGVTAAVVRASAGASEHVRVYRASNISKAMRTLQDDGIVFYGLDANEAAQSYTSVNFTVPAGLVVGSEGDGLSRLVRETCDGIVRLPLGGKVQSLNAAVAGAVALFEVVRQRDAEV